VRIYQGNEYFRKKKLRREVTLTNHDWREVELAVDPTDGRRCYIVLETNRDWQPLEYSGAPDARRLAVALGQLYFVYPKEIQAERIIAQRTIPAQSWEGEQGALLYRNGRATIHFRSDSGFFALRLHLKGRKALGLGPMTVVSLDGMVIAQTLVQSEDWTSLVLEPRAGPGEHSLEVAFINDLFDPAAQRDRNLKLGDLDVLYVRRRTDSKE
jgi:hypothetical protein